MVTKAKKALLASLAAFLCVMLTVFGLSMSVSLSETAKAADETSAVAQVGTTTYGTLNGAIGAAADGNTVTLLKDTTEDVVVDKDITLDLNGFTLNGGTGTAKAAITNYGTLTIKDSSAAQTGTIKREDNGTVGETSYYVIRNLGTMTIEQANVVNNSGYRETNPSGSMIGSSLICNGDNDEGATLTIKGGKLTQTNFIAIKNGANGTLVVNGGEITSNHSAVQNWYNATITGGKITGQIWTDAYKAGESVGNTVIDGDVKFTGEIVMDVYGSIKPELTINGGNLSVTNWRVTTACAELGGKPAVQGGTFTKAVPAEYCAEGFVPTEIEAGKYGVKAEPLTFDEDGICRISTEAELKRFAEMANAGDNFAGKTVYLENDIDLNNKLWTPIGVYNDSKTHFKGTFDGQNHTITGLKVNESRKNGVGFFGKVNTGTIKNLTVEGTVSVSGCNYVGGIVGHGYATITNCTFKGSVGSKDTMQVGGIAGSGGFDITNCSVYGNVIAECWAGGIVGNCQDGGAYINCYVDGTISAERTYWGGGAAGITPVPLYPSQVISQCYSDTVVKVAGEEVNCPIIAAYNNPLDYNGYTGDLKIYNNSWNKAKNPNDSYPIYAEQDGKGGVLQEGKVVSRDNTLIMLEGDLNYIDRKLPRSKIKILPGSAVTAKTIDDMTVAAIGEEKYFSLEAAIDAAKSGATVKLLADTGANVTIAKKLTLDLNGYTINGGTVKATPTILVSNCTVTITDSSKAKTGTVMREDTAENSGVSSHYVIDIQGKNGFLIVEGGNFVNNSGAGGTKGASLIRLGDDRVSAWPTLTIKGGTFTQDNFIVLKVDRGTLHFLGGTLNSAKSYAVENWNNAYIKGGTINGAVSSWVYSGGAAFSKLEISAGTINGDVESVSYDGATDKQARVYITGGEITGKLSTKIYGSVSEASTAMATIEVTGGTFSKDPTKYVVEGSAITKNENGTFGVEKAYLAQVGDKKYYTMDEAFHAAVATGGTLVLLRDYTTSSVQNSGSNSFTIDLNGHTWTCTITDMNSAAFEINYADVTLTVKNGKIISNSLVGLIPTAMGGTIKYDNAGLVFEKVEMTANGHSGIETNGDNTNDSVTLKDSTLNVPNGFGIYFPSSGTLTIDKSTINAKTMGVQVCSGTLNINAGSAITVTGDGVTKTENDGAIEDGAAISVVNRAGYKGLSNIVITGGKFTAKAGNDAIKAYDWVDKVESTFTLAEKVAVSGGAFTSAVPAEYCAEGFIPTQNADGKYGVKEGAYVAKIGEAGYETLAEAIAAAKDGDTVKLLADVEQNSEVSINKNITLDLNGKKIYNTKDIWHDTDPVIVSLIAIRDGAEVTVMGNGTIAAKANDCYTINIVNGKLTIENGTFVGNISVVQVQKGTLTINGGTFSLIQKMTDGKGEDRYLINCIDEEFTANNAQVAIYGGSFAGFDPNVSPEKKVDGKVPSFAAPGVGITKNVNGSFTAKANMAAQILDSDGNSVAAYATLEEALNAATRNATVMLLADTRENVTIATMLITLDLNGYTINGGTVKGKPAVTVTANGVTIKDSSAAQTGTIKREDTAENSGVSSHYVIDVQGVGRLTFESGNVINHSGNKAGKGASLVRVGDASVRKQPGLVINGGTFTQDNFIVIKVGRGYFTLNGGTLNSANTYAIENWFRATVNGGTVNGAVSSWTYSGGVNSTLEILGGTINGDVTSVNYGNATDKKATVSVTGGTITGELDTRSYDPATGELTSINDAAKATIGVSGGTFTNAVPANYCAEGFIPTKNADGTFGVEKTEKVYLAKIGETFYSTMEEAFEAQKTGEAIVLLRDYTTASKFNSGSINRVVDLNGHTWTYTGARMNEAAFEINYSGVTLTVKNGTIISNTLVGLIPSTSKMDGTIIAYDNAGLVFEGVTMTSNGSSGIETNGNNTDDSVTLKNSTLNVPNGFGIYFPSSGTLTIDNSKINAKTMGVQVCSGELNINAGSEITVTGDAVTKTENDGAIQDGAAISIVNRPGYKGLSDIVITGGTFTAKAGNDAIKAYDWANKVESTFTKADLVAVSGGTFSSEVNKDYLADRFVVNKNTDGTYGVTAGSGFAGANVVVTESLAMKVTIANGTASKYVIVTYKGLDGTDKSAKLETLTNGCYLFDKIMPQMIDVKFSFELYDENDVMLDRKANYSVVDYLADIIASEKDSAAFRNVAASLIEYANRAKTVKGLATIAPEFVKGTEKVDLTELYRTFIADEKNKIPAKDTLGAISEGDGQVIYQAKVVFDDAYTLTFYTNDNEKQYTYKLDDKDIVFDENGKYTVNVLAQNITTKYVLTVYDKDSKLVQTVTYGVSTYCIRMQETETPQGELYVASYYYGVAVNQYGTANPNSVQG